MRLDAFLFVDVLPSEINASQDFIARIPPNILDRKHLFTALQCELKLPGYFGHNWDALDECLGDFQWISERKIVMFHEELPALEADSLRIYLEVLADAVEFWKLHIEHELIVVFPAKYQDACQHALRESGPVIRPSF